MDYKARIIVNADDFGDDENSNSAILESFNLGLISSTTILCNRPAFKEACELAHQNKLIDSIGIHLNITKGQPLTEAIKKHPKFYTNDKMYQSFKGHFLSSEESKVVFQEFQAQLDKCKNEDIIPTHFDSHHGMHYYWGFGKVVIDLALKNKIPAIRLRHNWGNISKKGNTFSKGFFNFRGKVYSKLFNYRISNSGLAKTKYFCEINKVTPELLSKDNIIEVNTHPWLSDENILIDSWIGTNLIELKKKYLPVDHFINYKSIE